MLFVFPFINVPGIGEVDVAPGDDIHPGATVVGNIMSGYTKISDIKKKHGGAKKEPKPAFILSKSKTFRRRVGRILYGKEGEDIFLD